MVNRSFSVTWSAPLQIAWNKRKKILTCEKSLIPTGCFCTQTWPPIHRFVHKYGCRDVMWKRSISKEITGNKKISKWMERVCNKLKLKTKNWHGCFEINSMSRTRYFFRDLSRAYDIVRVFNIGGKIIKKWSEGKQKLLHVSGRFKLSRGQVPEGKITVNVWRKSWGNRLWFELARGRVIGSQRYLKLLYKRLGDFAS